MNCAFVDNAAAVTWAGGGKRADDIHNVKPRWLTDEGDMLRENYDDVDQINWSRCLAIDKFEKYTV